MLSSETTVVTSYGLICGVADSYRQELMSDLQSHLCRDTARMVYEYSVCNAPCSLRGRAGGKQCCSCRDIRPFNPSTLEVTTRVYLDGKGYVMQKVPRSKWYCPQCRAAPEDAPATRQGEDDTTVMQPQPQQQQKVPTAP